MVSSNTPVHKWAWLTWLQLGLILVVGAYLSVLLRNYNNSLLLYLPSALGVVLIQWFGPRVLLLSYLNGILTLFLWNAPGGWSRYLLLASHEPLVCFLSWLFARKLINTGSGFSTTRLFVQFTLFGIAIPGLANCFYTYHYSFVGGDLTKVFLLWLADFITMYAIAVPALHFLKPAFMRHGLISLKSNESDPTPTRTNLRDSVFICLFFIGLNFLIDFSEFWFVYGICAVIIAVRRGFEAVLLTNIILFCLSYLFPMVFLTNNFTIPQPLLFSVHLGMITMFFVSSLIGRAISDFRKKEIELTLQKKQLENANEQLNKTNSELDRFVYSVSHDISAPLKSIKGLVSLSRLDKDTSATGLYLDKIDASVQKLEGFIGEVLDHSRTVRKEIKLEPVDIELLVNDINDNLKYLDNFGRIYFLFDFKIPTILTDKFLLKVALSNLLSNAIKYQKRYQGHQPEIKVSTNLVKNQIEIRIADNGEGIAEAYKDRVFEMFYRGTSNSTGSGLGLYIAKEAVEKLQGTIRVETTYGTGSVFALLLPHP